MGILDFLKLKKQPNNDDVIENYIEILRKSFKNSRKPF